MMTAHLRYLPPRSRPPGCPAGVMSTGRAPQRVDTAAMKRTGSSVLSMDCQ